MENIFLAWILIWFPQLAAGSGCTTPLQVTGAVQKIDGGNWFLVRRVRPGNHWHPSTDNLAGTEPVYGHCDANYSAAATFGIPFSTFFYDQFLFTSGDLSEYAVVNVGEVYDEPMSSVWRVTTDQSKWGFQGEMQVSSLSTVPYNVTWYLREGKPEDPILSTGNVGDYKPATYVYAEASATNFAQDLASLSGANVFIRKKHGAALSMTPSQIPPPV
ncbi:hypothetical protein CYMTET_34426 [Cymbomonas tetramitiformis]|uniref:Uncharacterized protein n=1 Tax=Cymbomonas tetramitiformis TaxID=36881 RepID=A0AAE0FBB9_9CHLO|nr:hypothetical protein CYMTET_34426 [Cymbomonas tetramitiformis]